MFLNEYVISVTIYLVWHTTDIYIYIYRYIYIYINFDLKLRTLYIILLLS